MNDSKVKIAVSKTVSFVQILAGVAILLWFGLCTIIYLTDKEFAAEVGVGFLIFCLVLDALGVWLIVLSRKKTKLMREFKKYVAAVSNDADGFIPDIAISLGTSEEVVRKNLELMIKKKYFANAFIDYRTNCIKIANRHDTVANAAQQTQVNLGVHTAPMAAETVTIKCRGCGGINTIQKGAVGVCDYCGSPIKGE